MFLIQVLKHKVMIAALGIATKILKFPRPEMFVGGDSSLLLCDYIAAQGHQKILLVTDPGLTKIGLYTLCKSHIERAGLDVEVFDAISPNPTCHQMEAGILAARVFQADAVLAFGGGSSIDSGKVIAAGAPNNRPVVKLEGTFKIKQAPLPVYAIPTTAGTGSEVTPAAVVTHPEEQRKFSVGDLKLVPEAAALDAKLMLDLPPKITTETGLDVLTHAIEAYVSTMSHEKLKQRCIYAIKVVFSSLVELVDDGRDERKRTAMAVASYQAGLAIAEAGVGYVHALAHKIGGKYDVPHGLANAIILPYVLEFQKDTVSDELAELAQAIGRPADADAFIQAVIELNQSLDIPAGFVELKAVDIPEIYTGAQQEAMSLFPVPKYMRRKEGEALLKKLILE